MSQITAFENSAFYPSRSYDGIGEPQVWEQLETDIKALGFESACCRCFPLEPAINQNVCFNQTSSFPSNLKDLLTSLTSYRDPFRQASIRLTQPMLVKDIPAALPPRSPALHWYNHKVREISCGALVPVFGPLFRSGYFWFIGPDSADRRVLAELHSKAQSTYLTICAVIATKQTQGAALSERELEVLQQISMGKTNDEIADCLSITPATINTYLKRTFEKLDVTNRVSAIVRARATGYLI